MTPRYIALAALPPILWAIAYTIAKPATAHFPPLFLMSMVYALTAIVLVRPWQRWRTPFWAIVASATLGGAVQSALIFSGIARVPASMAILVVQSQVPFAVLAAWVVGQERMNPRRLTGICVSLIGVALVVGTPQSLGEIGGLLLIVLGTAAWGMAQGVIRIASKDAGNTLMSAIALLAAPQLLALSLWLESGQIKALSSAGWLDWAAVVALAFAGYAVAYSIWYSLLGRFRVDQIAPFALLMPIVGVLTSALLLGERPSLPTLAGGAIVLIASPCRPRGEPGACIRAPPLTTAAASRARDLW